MTRSEDEIRRQKDKFLRRQEAYQGVFSKENRFTDEVLKDLAKFCRGYTTTFHEDPRIHAALEGRREVYLRILYHAKLNPDQFLELYGRFDLNKE